MTGIYPFKIGLQRGFGKRSPQVSFSLDWVVLKTESLDILFKEAPFQKRHFTRVNQSENDFLGSSDKYHHDASTTPTSRICYTWFWQVLNFALKLSS